jgi:hypothetical protein
MPQAHHWLAMITSLPTDDAGARMRIMRTLEAMGCAVLRDGVYLFPDSPSTRQGLTRLCDYVIHNKGSAQVLNVVSNDEAQTHAFRGLFNRAERYVEVIKTIEGLRAGFGIAEPTSIAKVLSKKRRELEAITALDFFPNEFRTRAEQVLGEAEAAVQAQMFRGGAAEQGTSPETQSGEKFLKRTWATRQPAFADRLASAWLIRRFIDPEAKLIWLNKSEPCPVTAIGYAFDGARFTNSASRVTFEELLLRFGLDKDQALPRIGRLVHQLDFGGSGSIPEAAGVATLLQGAQRRGQDESETQRESERTFDLLYDAYFDVPKARP